VVEKISRFRLGTAFINSVTQRDYPLGPVCSCSYSRARGWPQPRGRPGASARWIDGLREAGSGPGQAPGRPTAAVPRQPDGGGGAAALFLAIAASFVLRRPADRRAAGLDATAIDARLGATPPGAAHWFGTDPLGRYLLWPRDDRRTGIAIARRVVAAAHSPGDRRPLPARSRVRRGAIDNEMMRWVDALLRVPEAGAGHVVMR